MNRTKNLPAFTLMELLFVMLITGIIFTVGYQAYGLVNKQYADFRTFNDQVARLTLLNTVLGKDIAAANAVREAGNRIECYDYENRMVQYVFYPDMVVRNNLIVSDTFLIAPDGFQTEAISLPAGGGSLVTSVYFQATLYGIDYPYHYQKNYGKEVLMRAEADQSSGIQ